MSPYRTNAKQTEWLARNTHRLIASVTFLICSLTALLSILVIQHCGIENARRARVVCEARGMRPLWHTTYSVTCASANGLVCNYNLDSGTPASRVNAAECTGPLRDGAP